MELSAVGEGIASPTDSLSTEFSFSLGQLKLILPPPTEEIIKVISDLRAREDILGSPILEGVWQKDNDPYFYWQIDITPPSLLSGFSVSLDTSPDSEIDTTSADYQFPEDSISSGKHTFYVLPFTTAGIAKEESLLQFAIWVDLIPPNINQLSPSPGELTPDKYIPISCLLYDADSGLDTTLTTLTLNNNTAFFNYDAEKQLFQFTPDTPLPEGKNTVLLKAYDLVGNYIVKGWDFIVDTQGPWGSVLINNGQELTHSAFVFINIDVKDTISGIKNVYISNDGIFDTELNHPYPYNAASPFLSNWLVSQADLDGIKTVYVKFEDLAGNFSSVYKDEIALKLFTPDTRIVSGPASLTEETAANFTFEASKSGCQFSYKLDNLAWSEWSTGNTAQFSALTEGNHYFFVKSGFDLNGDGAITPDEEDATPAQWVWSIKPKGALEKVPPRILFWRR
jgi:hypothetical protein